jgi:hypothetical protein
MKNFWFKLRGLLKSKTFWTNLITGILVFIDQTQFHFLDAKETAGVILILNMILRWLTTGSLESKVQPAPAVPGTPPVENRGI